MQHADSELVRRYRRAGLVVLGMTNTPELGKNASTDPDLHGSTPNPRSPRHTVGGSSGGSAAAVASGMVPVAHANDGGGSIRIPAVVNGLFGLKPSRGRVSPAPYPSSFAAPNGVQHALTRTVRDSALLLDVAAGSLAGDVFGFGARDDALRTGPGGGGPFSEAVRREPGRLRVGLIESLRNGPDVDPECLAAVRGAAGLLESLGHEVSPVAAPWDSTHVAATSGLLMGVSLVGAVDDRLARLGRELREDDLEPFTRVLLDHYRATTGPRLHEALEAVQLIAWQVGSAFDDVDVLLSPVMCVPTPEIGFWDTRRPETMYERGVLSSAFTTVFNLSGMPAMAVPHGTDSRGLPIGFQAAAPLGREDVLLSLAAQVERAAPWPLLADLA
ncbi:amidase [Actinocorallia sp. B10E7]|uniref:amidase n=1 Tax=Actinocorallia sp. B10E7 TaxID=3153558 RepID=UPI00325C6ED4